MRAWPPAQGLPHDRRALPSGPATAARGLVDGHGLAGAVDLAQDRCPADPVDGRRGLSDAVGAQAAGFHAGAPWPQPRRPLGSAPAHRRCPETADQGNHPAHGGQPGLVRARAGDGHHAGAGRLGGDFLLARCGAGQCQRGAGAGVVFCFGRDVVLVNVKVGLVLVMAITSIEVYGVIIAGWASNSKYAFLGALRASAQMVSYEIAMGFCLLIVIMVWGSMNLTEIVLAQGRGVAAANGIGFLSWNWLPLLPVFLVYLISGVAETNRHPFDVVEGEAEIVAGHMVEYSGMGFAIFFLAEYASMWLVSILAALMFLGGWLPPVDSASLHWIPGWIWLGIKTCLVVSMFIWIRATFPRFRYDQIMRLGWKIFIPVTLACLLIAGGWLLSPWNIWK